MPRNGNPAEGGGLGSHRNVRVQRQGVGITEKKKDQNPGVQQGRTGVCTGQTITIFYRRGGGECFQGGGVQPNQHGHQNVSGKKKQNTVQEKGWGGCSQRPGKNEKSRN